MLRLDERLGWMFPAGTVLLLATAVSLATMWMVRATPPPCEIEGRVLLSFVLPAFVGGLLTPLAFPAAPLVRAAAAAGASLLCGGAVWWAVASQFPQFC
jgi:hypothetical protein